MCSLTCVDKFLFNNNNNNYQNTYNLLPRHQSAYRKYHLTETLLAKVVSDLISEASNCKHTLLAMLDLSAAFDMVDHNILIQRLSLTFGITDTLCNGLHHIFLNVSSPFTSPEIYLRPLLLYAASLKVLYLVRCSSSYTLQISDL